MDKGNWMEGASISLNEKDKEEKKNSHLIANNFFFSID